MKKTLCVVVLLILALPAMLHPQTLVNEARYFPEKNDIYFYADLDSVTGFFKTHGIPPEDSLLVFGDKSSRTMEPLLASFKLGVQDIQEVMISGQTEEIEKNSGVLVLFRVKPRKGEIPAELLKTAVTHEGVSLYRVEPGKEIYLAKIDDTFVAGFKSIITAYLSRRNAKQTSETAAVRTFSSNSAHKTLYMLVSVSKYIKEKMDASIRKGSVYGKGLNENVFIKSLLSLNSIEFGLVLGNQVDLFTGLQSSGSQDGERLLMVSHFLIVGSSLAVSFMDAWSKSMGQKGTGPGTSPEEMAKIQAMFGRIRTRQVSNGVMLSFEMNAGETSTFVKQIQKSIQAGRDERTTRLEKEKTGAFNDAIRLGNLARVKSLFEAGVNINGQDKDGTTPLSAACDAGRIDIIDFLIRSGADVNGRSANGITPLHKAAAGGHLEAVKLLVEKKADVNAEDSNGEKAYDKARNGNHADVAEYFEKNFGQGPESEEKAVEGDQ